LHGMAAPPESKVDRATIMESDKRRIAGSNQ